MFSASVVLPVPGLPSTNSGRPVARATLTASTMGGLYTYASVSRTRTVVWPSLSVWAPAKAAGLKRLGVKVVGMVVSRRGD